MHSSSCSHVFDTAGLPCASSLSDMVSVCVPVLQCRPLSKTVRFNVLQHEPAVNQVSSFA